MEKIVERLTRLNRLYFSMCVLVFSLLGPFIANQLPAPPDINPSHVERLGKLGLGITALFIAPIVETLVFQCLPAVICRRISTSEIFLLVFVIVPFGLMHFIPSAPAPSLINGFAGALSLGFCYLTCMRDSHTQAFFVTAVIHSAHNAIVLFLLA